MLVKILVIEDEKKIASFIRKGLEAQGFVVETAAHGDEGFLLATTRPYDALVLDIMLPGKDGLVHVSQISNDRVEKVSDALKEGDVVKVKVLEVDKQGRIRLSMKAVAEGEGV